MTFIVIILGFLSGITLQTFGALGWPFVAWCAFLSASFFFLFIRSSHRSLYVLTAGFILCAAFGSARVTLMPDTAPAGLSSRIGEEVVLEGVVVADPDVREVSVRLVVRVQEEGEAARVLVVAPLYPVVRYGEQVRVVGTLHAPASFDTDHGRTFRYDQFLAKDGIFVLMHNVSLEVVGPRSGILHSVRGFFSDLKQHGTDALSQALPEPHASLASGLILGGKQGLGDELLQNFIVTGLVHIVVLSGYNVMVVAEAVYRVLAVFAQRFAAPAAGAVILAFVLVAGAGAASVRAGIMAGIAFFGRATGRTYDAFRALLVAAVLMLVWNPLLLIYDPGFQLSFVATLGLIFGAPLIERRLTRVRPEFLRGIMASTIAAQIAVLPLLLYQNGLLSLVALPANVLVLPLVPFAMGLTAFAGLVGFIAPVLAPVAGFPAYVLLSLIVWLTQVLAQLPLASVSVPQFPFVCVVGAYMLLTWVVLKKASSSAAHTKHSARSS